MKKWDILHHSNIFNRCINRFSMVHLPYFCPYVLTDPTDPQIQATPGPPPGSTAPRHLAPPSPPPGPFIAEKKPTDRAVSISLFCAFGLRIYIYIMYIFYMNDIYIYTYLHMHIYIYMCEWYIYIYISCVCVLSIYYILYISPINYPRSPQRPWSTGPPRSNHRKPPGRTGGDWYIEDPVLHMLGLHFQKKIYIKTKNNLCS
jgi:hypothetical protein